MALVFGTNGVLKSLLDEDAERLLSDESWVAPLEIFWLSGVLVLAYGLRIGFLPEELVAQGVTPFETIGVSTFFRAILVLSWD